MAQVPLYRLAHCRTGDKGNRSNLAVIAWKPELYPLLVEQLTEAVMAKAFAHRQVTRVTRYAIESLHALNFVIDEALDGGVNSALNLDSHGKTLSFMALELPVEVPASLMPHLIHD
jgi:hypothetical protein